MITGEWGLLGPGAIAQERRTRTLGVARVVRAFNDLAVPGMGGAYFGKQLTLPLLGVAVAERLRAMRISARNIEVANTVEAIASFVTLKSNSRQSDPRIKGITKLPPIERLSSIRFAEARKPTFYVSQPMRMASVQALPALGLVTATGERFNSFAVGEDGERLLRAAFGDFRPDSKPLIDFFVLWASGERRELGTSGKLTEALCLTEPMPIAARELLTQAILTARSPLDARRRAVWEWAGTLLETGAVRATARASNWENKPEMIEAAHWRDLRAGAAFFGARDLAIAALDAVESEIPGSGTIPLDKPLPGLVRESLDELRKAARLFLNNEIDPTSEGIARRFCEECLGDDATVMRNLAIRDDRVICLRDGALRGGSAYRAGAVTSTTDRSLEDDPEAEVGIHKFGLPEGVSHRVFNLARMRLDMNGELSEFIETSRQSRKDSA